MDRAHSSRNHTHQQTFVAVTKLLPFLILVGFLLPETAVKAQSDTILTAESSTSTAVNEPRASGGIAIFVGFHQGLEAEPAERDGYADWLLGVSRTIPLGSDWELSPEVSLWHLTPIRRVVGDSPSPTGIKPTREKWNVNAKLGIPIRWFPVMSGRFAPYVLGGPAYLFSSQEGDFILDAGGGLLVTLSGKVALAIEARTYLYYPASASAVQASPLSIMVGVRWRQ